VLYQYSEVRRLNELNYHDDVQDQPGVYLFLNALNGPVVYVGRSDTSLRRRIRKRSYAYYIFIHCDTVHEAYWLECRFYHLFSNLQNDIHPRIPEGFNLISDCPKCGYRQIFHLLRQSNL
jgi:hypothetical protein